ncbi:hypothetical protein NDU88_010921 [Pleurodeles waltl]|uniref:Uncharacterized protein n=1 Tax=Pleurodeles waltl TaxID=8319 RepID=A0AAV7QXR3_PLEWA|nr:hypothetical protein NDU88_010921 [Pleurodeles waltl]
MEDHGSSTLFSPEENQTEPDMWTRFMAMGQAKGLEWAKKMVAAQGVQQPSETPALMNTDEVQPSDSGKCSSACQKEEGGKGRSWEQTQKSQERHGGQQFTGRPLNFPDGQRAKESQERQ